MSWYFPANYSSAGPIGYPTIKNERSRYQSENLPAGGVGSYSVALWSGNKLHRRNPV